VTIKIKAVFILIAFLNISKGFTEEVVGTQNTNTVEKNEISVIVTKQEKIPPLSILWSQAGLGSSIVSEKFSGYNVTLKNTGPNTVRIVNAKIVNGVDGVQAYNFTKRNTLGRTLAWGLAFGAVGMACTSISNSKKNNKARNELNEFGLENISGVDLKPGELLKTKVLIPVGSQPELKGQYQDVVTSEVYYIQ
jgi:hypothetical protein